MIIQTVGDTVELLSICSVISYITYQKLKNKEEVDGKIEFSTRIIVQLIIMLTQSVLWNVKNYWCVTHDTNFPNRDDFTQSVWLCYNLAAMLFLIQHALFIGSYVQVAIALPYTFCLQSESVVRRK